MQRFCRRFFLLPIGMLMLGLGALPAGAGQITGWSFADDGGGAATSNVGANALPGGTNNNAKAGTPDPSDDNTSLEIHYNIDWTVPDPVVVTFGVADTAGVTEYAHNLNFDNHTPFTWTGLIVELGAYDGAGGFTPGVFAGLDFDTSPDDLDGQGTPFYALNHSDFNEFLKYVFTPPPPQIRTDGRVELIFDQFEGHALASNVSNNTLIFATDVPDDPGTALWQQGSGDYQFALRFTPVADVPEPAAAVLMGLGGLAIALRRRR